MHAVYRSFSFQDQSCRKREYFGQVEEFCFLREQKSPKVFFIINFQVSPALDCIELQLGRVQQVPEGESWVNPSNVHTSSLGNWSGKTRVTKF